MELKYGKCKKRTISEEELVELLKQSGFYWIIGESTVEFTGPNETVILEKVL